MLHDSGDSALDGDFEGAFVVKVLDNLLDSVGIKDHADDTAGALCVHSLNSGE